MDNSPLNEAHYLHRRAEARLRQSRFDEAISCHKRAIEQLLEVLSRPVGSGAILSIQLQIQYHIKQQDLIAVRKLNHEYKKNKLIMPRYLGMYKDRVQDNVKGAVDQSFKEAENLALLLKSRLQKDIPDSYEYIGCGDDAATVKKILPEEKLIDELLGVLRLLRNNVNQLYSQLDIIQRENHELRIRCKSSSGEDSDCLVKHEASLSPPKYHEPELLFSFSPPKDEEVVVDKKCTYDDKPLLESCIMWKFKGKDDAGSILKPEDISRIKIQHDNVEKSLECDDDPRMPLRPKEEIRDPDDFWSGSAPTFPVPTRLTAAEIELPPLPLPTIDYGELMKEWNRDRESHDILYNMLHKDDKDDTDDKDDSDD